MGGYAAAESLSRNLGNKATVTVVEPRAKISFPPAFLWIALGWREPGKIQKDLKKLTRRKNIRLIPETVEKIDVKGRTVRTQSKEIQYDKLVIALGAELVPSQVPGLDNFGFNPYSLDGALKLKEKLQTFQGGTVIVGISQLPIKCPPAPYEFALLLEEKFRTEKKKADIIFFTPEPHPVPAAGSVIGKQIERLLSNHGIKYLPKTKIAGVDNEKTIFDGSLELKHDLLVAVPPHYCPRVVVDAGLTDSSGWVPVNPQTLMTKHDSVYAIGDVTAVETPHGHAPFLPKSGVLAQGQAETVANNISVAVTGKGQGALWDGIGACFLQVSKSESALLRGSFLSKPPRVEFHPPRRKWFLDMVKMEKEWLSGAGS